ncbi:hypothetical protein NLC35_02875 [Candidatus Aminicenantes bacterium AC-334-K16]|jgi:hypothetical protein|nr:hypothetical protein [Candidatus Aminicenantes bacterium AC-334-K16]
MWKNNRSSGEKVILYGIILLNVLLILPLGGLSDLVICLGEDGHVALEPVHSKQACFITQSKHLFEQPGFNERTTLVDNSHRCIDFYFNGSSGKFQVQEITFSPKSVLLELSWPHVINWGYCLPEPFSTLSRADPSYPENQSPSLKLLRSIILLI